MTGSIKVVTADEMLRLGEGLGRLLRGGEVFALSGPLGAGKTTFVQGVARGLAVTGWVTSPSFSIIHVHEGRLRLIHCDFYRLDSQEEMQNIGFEDYLAPDSVVFAEWGQDFLSGTAGGVTHLCITNDGARRELWVTEVAGRDIVLMKEWIEQWRSWH